MIELCCEYLSVRCIWLYVFPILCTPFKANSHSIVVWMSKNSFLQNRRQIWSLSHWQGTRTHVCKRKLNHLDKLEKWLSCAVSTYLYGAFDCKFLSCDIRVSEWIHTLLLTEYEGTPCTEQGPNLKLKRLQRGLKAQPLSF